MDREEILAKSRNENHNKDMVEEDAVKQGYWMGMSIGAAVCMLVNLLEVILADRFNLACWIVYASMTGTMFCVKYIRLRKKHELILSIFWFAAFLAFLGLYVWELVRAA